MLSRKGWFFYSIKKEEAHLSGSRPCDRRFHVEREYGEMASARGSGGSKCWGLCGFADQYAVGGRSCAGHDAEQGIEGSMACSAPIEAEHELVEVMLEVCFPQSVIDAQTPALEVWKQPMDPETSGVCRYRDRSAE